MADELAVVSRPFAAGELDVLRLGRVPYRAAHALQQQLVERRIAREICDTLVLCEHDPVVTVGRGSPAPVLADGSLEAIEVERGGEATSTARASSWPTRSSNSPSCAATCTATCVTSSRW